MSFVAPAPQRVVRPAGRADAAQVVRLLENANEQYEKLLPAEIFDVYLADLRVLPFRTDVELAVVEFDSRIVGSVAFRSTASSPAGDVPGFAGFRALSVAPDARGVGVGRALALWAIGRARSINAKGVAIHSASFQTTAHNLYAASVSCANRRSTSMLPSCWGLLPAR
jgi:GNAT superfamily N-acetyltransferase